MLIMAKPPKHPDSIWPAKLKALRKRLGKADGSDRPITQAEAARRLGIKTRTWVAWENRSSIPSSAALTALWHVFKIRS